MASTMNPTMNTTISTRQPVMSARRGSWCAPSVAIELRSGALALVDGMSLVGGTGSSGSSRSFMERTSGLPTVAGRIRQGTTPAAAAHEQTRPVAPIAAAAAIAAAVIANPAAIDTTYVTVTANDKRSLRRTGPPPE